MVAFLVTVLAILLLVGIIYLLLQEPQLLAAGSAIGLGVIFASLPLIVTMAPFFGALVFGAGAVAITYGVMSINSHRRTQDLRRELMLRQIRPADRDLAALSDIEPDRSHDLTPEDEASLSGGGRMARTYRRLAKGEDGRAVRGRAERAAYGDELEELAPVAPAARTAADRIGEEIDRMDRLEQPKRSAGAGRRGGRDGERARSLARLARRRP